MLLVDLIVIIQRYKIGVVMKQTALKKQKSRSLAMRLRYCFIHGYYWLLKYYLDLLNLIGRAPRLKHQIHATDSLRDITRFIAYCQNLNSPRPAPESKQPVAVSIIIPVFNQWHYTYACINSILEVCHGEVSYELILADDCSYDETLNAQYYFPGINIVRTPENVGFLRNCNHAAQYAQGRYLMLLNNDTIVLPNWLESLFQVLERDPSCAIAGSKLLYANSTIQEAGARVFADGVVKQWGKKQPRNTPEFNRLTEAHYISGCSILVRASFWHQIGGFDTRYQQGYFEDSDLAMTARQQHMRVIYQPASEVIHFKHKTYSNTRTGHGCVNKAIFLQKWSKELAQ